MLEMKNYRLISKDCDPILGIVLMVRCIKFNLTLIVEGLRQCWKFKLALVRHLSVP